MALNDITDIKTQVKHTEIQGLRQKGADCRFLVELGRSTKTTFQLGMNFRSLGSKK